MGFSVFQALWGMTALPYGGQSEWSIDEKVQKSLEGGFDGLDIPWTPLFPSEEALQIVHRQGIPYGITCFPTSAEDFRHIAQRLVQLETVPRYVNVQPNVRVFTVDEGVSYLRDWSAIAEEAEININIETHRDRMTTNLRFTLQLIEALPELRLTADLSHYVVGEEFEVWPVSDENHQLIHRIIERSDAFHGRVGSREQVQITSSWECHRPWLELFSGWWEEGFSLWRARSTSESELHFVTELGPPWYAITGADGKELSDRWEEALFLQGVAREIWQRVETANPIT